MKTKSQKDTVDMSLVNAADALDTARDYLDKLCAAHMLMAGAWAPGDATYDAGADPRVQAFGENAAEVVAHLRCAENYFAEIREAVGITAAQSDAEETSLSQAAEE